MKKPGDTKSEKAANTALLKRELVKGLDSGVSKRSPEQIRADFRKAREAA